MQEPSRATTRPRTVPLGLRIEPPGGRGLRFQLADTSGLLERAPRGQHAPLGALLGSGAISLIGAPSSWRLEGPALLHVVELVRCGEELQRALGSGAAFVDLGFPGGSARVAIDRPAWALASDVVPWDAADVARALLQLGTDVARAVRWAVPSQGKNPYLDDVVTRAEAALATLRPSTPTRRALARVREPRAARSVRPLRREGGIRRLRFLPLADLPGVAGAGPATLVAIEGGVVLVSDRGADAFAWSGHAQAHRVARRGAAVAPDGSCIVATRDRLVGFPFLGTGARWFQPHDGAAVDPLGVAYGRTLLVTLERRGLRAIDTVTGHERWVFTPPRTRRLHVGLVGSIVLAASESGVLTGLDVEDGTVRFRVAAPLPFTSPPIAWGANALAGVGSESRAGLLALDPSTGDVRWLRELELGPALPPVAAGARAWMAGVHDGRTALACLDVRGNLLWQRMVPVGDVPAGLVRSGVDVLVTGASGSAVRVRRDGRPVWRLGGTGGSVGAVPPALERGVLLVAGQSLRAVDARTGRVLAELPGGRGIRSVAVGPRLDVARLDEAGDLGLYRLAGHFAVVE